MNLTSHILVGFMVVLAALLLTMAGYQFVAASTMAEMQPMTATWLRIGGFFWIAEGLLFIVFAIILFIESRKDNQS